MSMQNIHKHLGPKTYIRVLEYTMYYVQFH